jgi:alkylation response protein AidB-like acyl-CoA dehydrogenase
MPRDFGFGPDEELLRDLARRFLDENLPITKLRAMVARDPDAVYERGEAPGWDEGLWKQIVELGWPGLAVPESAGGLGVRIAGIAGVVEEVGRHALPSPLLTTLSTSLVLRRCGSEPARRWLERIGAGHAFSLAITDADGSWDPSATDVSATRDGEGLRLDGRACFVQDAAKVQAFLVSARTGERVSLCVVPVGAAGLRRNPDHIHDLTRDQATLVLEGVRIGPEDVVAEDGLAALEAAWPSLLVVLAADLCGTSEWQLQTTAEYARTRTQFERQIGFFQAVKHPLVDAMVGIDRARSLLYHAACCIDADDPEAEVAARMAKSAASDAGAFVSDRSVQLHGGIGFTWECDVHLYFKRSLHTQALLGDGVHQRRRLAELLL